MDPKISNNRHKDFGRALDQLCAPISKVASTRAAQREKINGARVPYCDNKLMAPSTEVPR